MAEPSQGEIAAGRIASIVIEALEPAERAGGVAYLCVTPFAAGQTLAVPLQPVAIDRDCYVAFIDAQPELPRYQSLIVMMEQCNSGGFNEPIIKYSTAKATSVASAAIATQSSYASPDGHWDSFARDWFAGQAGHDPYGAALAFNPDTNGDGKIEATEAFNYANAIRNPADSPQFDEGSAAGGTIWLGRQYIIWWWWCWILREVLERPYRELPEAEYYARLHEIQPELAKLAASLDDQSAVLRKEMTSTVSDLVARTFAGER